MSKGIIYVMTTAVSGLIKIGKTQTKQYSERMRFLEANGYYNVVGLKRLFAIEVADYSEKETLCTKYSPSIESVVASFLRLIMIWCDNCCCRLRARWSFRSRKIKKRNLIKSPKPRTVIKSLAFIEKASKMAMRLSFSKIKQL